MRHVVEIIFYCPYDDCEAEIHATVEYDGGTEIDTPNACRHTRAYAVPEQARSAHDKAVLLDGGLQFLAHAEQAAVEHDLALWEDAEAAKYYRWGPMT